MASTTLSALLLISLAVLATVPPTCLSSRHNQHESSSSPTSRPAGFSSTIIHRNSPRSPLYNPNLTRWDRVEASIRRTIARQDYLQTIKENKAINTKLWAVDASEYVMEFYIGTPKRRTYAMIDSGSSLTWLQCAPCRKCFYQKKAYIYNPAKSSSFYKLTCDDYRCKALRSTSPCTKDNECQYSLLYADNTTSKGDVARETLHFLNFGDEVTVENFVFGCGHENNNPFKSSEGIPGIIGLTRKGESLLKQLSYTRFLHCFGDINDDEAYGFAKFGEAAIISVHTTLMGFKEIDPFYYMILKGISVGNVRLPIPEELFTAQVGYPTDGFIIDSGTPYTRLNTAAFDELANELEYQMPKMDRMLDRKSGFGLCFSGGTSNIQAAPIITLHFDQDLNLELPTWNAWQKVRDGSYCLAMFSVVGGSMLGSYQLQNFNVGYDLLNRVISIDPYVCALDQLRH